MVKFEINEHVCTICSEGNDTTVEILLLAYAIVRQDKTLDLFTKLVEQVNDLIIKEGDDKSGKI